MNFGILGAGKIASVMAETINLMIENGHNDLKLYAVGARDLKRSLDFAKKYNIEKAYGSYADLVSDPALDLVYVATPHNFHYAHAHLCLEHHKAVLLEKAFTVNAKEAVDLIEFAKKQKTLITEAIWTRYQPMRKLINDELSQGSIGIPQMLTANLSYPMAKKERLIKPELAGGALLDVGIYTLNFAEMIFGRPDRAEGISINNALGCDMNDSITLTYNDTGRMAVLCSSALVSSDRFGFIHGSKGFMQVDNINNPQGYKIFNKEFELVKEVKCPKQLTGYEYEVIECIECMKKGLLECPSMPHEETIHMMQLMDTLRAQFGVKYPFE